MGSSAPPSRLSPKTSPRTLLFTGCLRDKDLTEMARILFPLFDSLNLEPRTLNLVLTPIDNPRAASLDDLIAAARALDIPAHPAGSAAEALALARALTPPTGLIIATGSVYLMARALRDPRPRPLTPPKGRPPNR